MSCQKVGYGCRGGNLFPLAQFLFRQGFKEGIVPNFSSFFLALAWTQARDIPVILG